MDSLKRKRLIWLIWGVAFVVIMGAKGVRSGWIGPRPPLELPDQQPVLLFFNNDQGCECNLVVYRQADAEIAAWPSPARQEITLLEVDLDRRPDLAKQYRIYRAPTLLLLNAQGSEVWRQHDVSSEMQVFDLEAFETQIMMLANERAP